MVWSSFLVREPKNGGWLAGNTTGEEDVWGTIGYISRTSYLRLVGFHTSDGAFAYIRQGHPNLVGKAEVYEVLEDESATPTFRHIPWP